MNPNDATPQPQQSPGDQPTAPPTVSSQPNPSEQLPVFHNPLAQGYEDRTAHLPPMPVAPPVQTTPAQMPSVANPVSSPAATSLPAPSNQLFVAEEPLPSDPPATSL